MGCEGCGQAGASAMDMQSMDLDGDGEVTEDEIRAFGAENGLSEQEIEELIASADSLGAGNDCCGASAKDHSEMQKAVG